MKKKEISTKKLLFGALISMAVLTATAICVFFALFVNTKKDRDIMIIPSFVGRKYTELESYDRIAFECELVYSDDVPECEIIAQTPYSGARRKVRFGELYTVKLTVSLGAEDRTLPDLEGFTYAEAASVLRALGAQIRIVSIYDDEGDSDRVLYTSPKAGERIEYGDRVSIFVCRKHVKGSIKVRDFTGLDQNSACAKILSEGLLVGNISFEPCDTAAKGTVISQSLAAGSYVKHGSTISITVSTGKEDEIDQLHPFGRYITDEDD